VQADHSFLLLTEEHRGQTSNLHELIPILSIAFTGTAREEEKKGSGVRILLLAVAPSPDPGTLTPFSPREAYAHELL
jgi:hypothetical protein